MQIVEKKVTELKAYEKNPRKNDNAVGPVAESIKEFGFKVPIIIDKDNVIVAGHTRLKAAKKLGMKTVPCIVADDLTPQQIKAFRVADNSSAQIASWDLSLLKDELMDLDFDMSLFGLEKEIKDIERIFAPEIIEDDVPEVDEKNIITKLGDIWQLGRHRLMCGDSTDEKTVELLMDGAKADMVFTDPPYGVSYEGINNDEESGLEELLLKSFKNYSENMKKGSPIYVFHADRTAHIFHNVFRKFFHFSSMLVWVKPALVLSHTDYKSRHEPCLYGWEKNGTHNWYADRKQTTVLEIGKERVDGHTTPKPLEFIGVALRNSSRKGDIVLDLFGGSGSTLIACEQLNRICYMMELDPKYCDVIIRRFENLTGQEAEPIERNE
jgi:site-specific DNA-methyltransferase (adenine-specific)